MAIDPLTAALSIGGQVIARIWPDPADQAKAQLALLELAQRGDLAQIEVNKVEAASSSAFTSSWRPFIGWICGAGCAWNWIGLPVASFVFSALGHPVAIYPADLGEMMPLLFGLLGMSGLRSFEKVKGVAS
jgi:hypothetical protein